jgi:CheY-like chemotaxis protein
MPRLVVFSGSDEVCFKVRTIGKAGGWDVETHDPRAPTFAREAVENADTALFDLQHDLDVVQQAIQQVARCSPYLPLVLLGREGFTLEELGSGLRYHIDPGHLDDLEHVLISLSMGVPMFDEHPMPIAAGHAVPRILIVDDNLQLATLIGRTLRAMERFDVRVATSGFEAVSILPMFQPDVAIIDLALGDVDGREICALIRNHEKLRNTRIIAVSGYLSESRAESGSVHFDAFLEKPFRMKDILSKVMAFLK